jgi:TetR/AcrR family transcriptional repressor of mexJK operon
MHMTKTKTAAPAILKHSPGRPKDTAKREGIVEAATALFLKDGFELTSMEAVAKKADVSKLTIYNHFADKVTLFREVIRQRCDKLATPECFRGMAELPPRQALLQIGSRLATVIYSADSVRLLRIMQGEVIHHPQVIKVFYEAGPQRVKQAFSALLTEWNTQGQLAIPDVECATEQFFSLLKGERMVKTMMLLIPEPSAQEINAHVKSTVDFFLAAYAPRHKNSKGSA